MLRSKPYKVLVCLLFLATMCAADASAYSIIRASAVGSSDDLIVPGTPQDPARQEVSPKNLEVRPVVQATPAGDVKPARNTRHVRKVKPILKVRPVSQSAPQICASCFLPWPKEKGWQTDAEVLFARTKGKILWRRGSYWGYWGGYDGFQKAELDFNSDMGLPDHNAVGTFTISYRFRPKWSMRYSLMPMELKGTGIVGKTFVFGGNIYSLGQNTRIQWERWYHRAGLVYDPIRTYTGRVGVFGEYVRIDEKLAVIQVGCCGDTYNNELNMGMAGLEFERCLKTGRFCNTLSIQCRAGVAFLDQAFGSDVSTGLKYTVPLGNGRGGFVEGGYRYLTFKKGYSDAQKIDTCMDGGFLKVGLVF